MNLGKNDKVKKSNTFYIKIPNISFSIISILYYYK